MLQPKSVVRAAVAVFLFVGALSFMQQLAAQGIKDKADLKISGDDAGKRPARLPIKPPVFDGAEKTVDLPEKMTDLAVGGGGRFLVLHLPKQKKLALFDVNEARIVHHIPLAEENVKFAAGMDKLVIAQGGDTTRLERWDLLTRKKEHSVPFAPGARIVKDVCMGSASQGPILIRWADDQGEIDPTPIELVDLQTLEIMTLRIQGQFRRQFVYRERMHFRASASGSVFGAWQSGVSPGGVYIFEVSGKTLSGLYKHEGRGLVIPGVDGEILYTRTGRLSRQLRDLDPPPERPQSFEDFVQTGAVPAAHGPFVLGMSVTFDRARGQRDNIKVHKFTLGMEGLARPLADLADVGFTMDRVKFEYGAIDEDKRFHLLPEAGLLIVVPPEDDKLVLHRIDVDAALEKSTTDYLFITTQAPELAVAGKTFEYQILVKARKEGLRFKLETGPDAMKVSPRGRVIWQVGAGRAGQDADIMVSIQNAGGQEIFHLFKVKVVKELPRGVELALQPAEPNIKELPPEAALKPVDVDRTIKPPALKENTIRIEFPEPIRSAVVGGGGRFLILHLPKARKLALLDVNEGRVVHHFPVDDGVRFAAGADKLVIVTPTNILTRWNLFTRQREAAIQLPLKNQLEAAVMGSASSSPLLLLSKPTESSGLEPFFLDLQTLKLLNIKVDGAGFGLRFAAESCHASADGKVFTGWQPDTSPHGVHGMVLEGDKLSVRYAHRDCGWAVPGADGKVVFTHFGMFGNDLNPLGAADPGTFWCLPAVHGDYYLAARLNRDRTVRVYRLGVENPLAAADLNEDEFSEQRAFLVPDAKVLLSIGARNERGLPSRLARNSNYLTIRRLDF